MEAATPPHALSFSFEMSSSPFIHCDQSYFKNYLKINPGTPPERLEAFKLPSIMNGKKVPYVGIKSCLVGGPREYVNMSHYN